MTLEARIALEASQAAAKALVKEAQGRLWVRQEQKEKDSVRLIMVNLYGKKGE